MKFSLNIRMFAVIALSIILSFQGAFAQALGITSVTPKKNALNVAKNTHITITFSSDINSSTLTNSTVCINGSLSGLHHASFSYNSGTMTATVTPTAPFRIGEVVYVTLTRGIVDQSSENSLENAFNWRFTVQADTATAIFTPTSSPGVGSNPYSVTAGDFNGDGYLDLAVANFYSNSVSILLNNGTGGFTLSSSPGVGSQPIAVATGDFNGDGYLDLVAVNYGSNTVSILLNDSSGGFILSSSPGVGSEAYSVAVGDYNGDGFLDIAVANFNSYTISILLNDGSGEFTLSSSPDAGAGITSVVAGDFNKDGYLDLAAVDYYSNVVSILLNDGSGGFTLSSSPGVGSGPFEATVADLNGDGHLDLAVTNYGENTVSILLNDSSGTFTPASPLTGLSSPFAIDAADLNGDGYLDLVVANSGSNTVSILLNNGSGGFTQSSSPSVGSSPYSVVAADFNGDGYLDIATANWSSNNVSILLEEGFGPTLSSPKSGIIGVSVNPELSWDASARATSYRLQIASDSMFTMIVYDSSGITKPSVKASKLFPLTKYYWRVDATTAGVPSDWSAVWSFTTANIAIPAEPVLVLTQNAQSLDIEEQKVISFLEKYGFKYKIADTTSISSGLDPSLYKIIVFRTGTEPTMYNQADILDAINNAVQNGSSLFLEFYGDYLGQYLGMGSVSITNWTPWTNEAVGFVMPIDASIVFEGFPTWSPPVTPDRPEQLFWTVTTQQNYNYITLTSVTGEKNIRYWEIETTYGCGCQSYNSSYCQSWGGCNADRSVNQDAIHYIQSGSGRIFYNNVSGFGGFCESNAEVQIGSAGVLLTENLINWAYVQNTSHLYSAGWNLAGFPIKDYSTLKDSVFVKGSIMYLNSYSPAGGYYPSSSISRGNGYWLGVSSSVSAKALGTTVIDNFSVPLNVGFNMIALPYLNPSYSKQALSVTDGMTVLSLDSAVAHQWVSPVMYSYKPGDGSYSDVNTLAPWNGYWFAAIDSSLQLIFNVPVDTAENPLDRRATPLKKKLNVSVADSNWFVGLTLQTAKSVDQLGGFGMAAGAKSGFDAQYDLPHPPNPPSPDYVFLVFPHPEWGSAVGQNFSADVRAPESRISWKLVAGSSGGATTATLGWDTAMIPPAVSLELTDVGNGGTRIDMKKVKSYQFTINGIDTLQISSILTVVSQQSSMIPKVFSLSQNYPNPFNPTTTIRYDIPERVNVNLVIYDILGRHMKTLVSEQKQPGSYQITFDGSQLASGVYFYRITAGKFTDVKKFVMMK